MGWLIGKRRRRGAAALLTPWLLTLARHAVSPPCPCRHGLPWHGVPYDGLPRAGPRDDPRHDACDDARDDGHARWAAHHASHSGTLSTSLPCNGCSPLRCVQGLGQGRCQATREMAPHRADVRSTWHFIPCAQDRQKALTCITAQAQVLNAIADVWQNLFRGIPLNHRSCVTLIAQPTMAQPGPTGKFEAPRKTNCASDVPCIIIS